MIGAGEARDHPLGQHGAGLGIGDHREPRPQAEIGQKRGGAAGQIRGDRHLPGRHRQHPGAVGIGQPSLQQPLHQRLAHARATSSNIGFSAVNRRR